MSPAKTRPGAETWQNPLRDKRDMALRATERAFGNDISVSRPKGGLHLWLRLPEDCDERNLVASAA